MVTIKVKPFVLWRKAWLPPSRFSRNSCLLDNFLWRSYVLNFMKIQRTVELLILGHIRTDRRTWSPQKSFFFFVNNASTGLLIICQSRVSITVQALSVTVSQIVISLLSCCCCFTPKSLKGHKQPYLLSDVCFKRQIVDPFLSNSSNSPKIKDMTVTSYPTFRDIRKTSAFWKVRRLRPFVLATAMCIWSIDHWWNYTDRRKQKYSEKKPVPVSFCQPQITHRLSRYWTRAFAVRDRRLTACDIARIIMD